MSTLSANQIQTVAGKPIVNSTGSILQVVQTVMNTSFSSSTKGSWVAITGLSASITPSSASNKIYALAEVQVGDENNYAPILSLYRNGSMVTPYGPTSGTTLQAYATSGGGTIGGAGVTPRITFSYLDSPASTSSNLYQVYIYKYASATSGINVNTMGGFWGVVSTLTLFEVSA